MGVFVLISLTTALSHYAERRIMPSAAAYVLVSWVEVACRSA
jgi:hypothetical protein